MEIFVFVLLASCMLCWLARWQPAHAPPQKAHTHFNICKYYYIAAVLIILFFAVCRADTVGADLRGYKKTFDNVRLGSSIGLREEVYAFLEFIVSRFTGNFNVFMAVCSILTLLPMLYVLYKETDSYLWLGMLMFIAEVYAASFNLVRASLACACMYMAYYFKYRKRYAYYLFMLLAFLFHYSSIVLILVFIFLDRKPSLPFCFIFVGAAVLLSQSELYLVKLGMMFVKSWKYESYLVNSDKYASFVPALNFFLFIILAFLCWMYRDKLFLRGRKNVLLVSVACAGLFFTVGLYWFSMTIRLVQLARMFMPLLIPQIIACEENRLYRGLLLAGFIILYLMLFVFFATGNNKVLPYRFFWQSL